MPKEDKEQDASSSVVVLPDALFWAAMGTTVTLLTNGAPKWWDMAHDCRALVAELEAVFSRFQPDSELNRFIRAEVIYPSETLLNVLKAAEIARMETAGAFNIQLSPDAPQFDLGGIAKGYAAEAVRERCRIVGTLGVCVSFGSSSVTTYGTKSDGAAWRIALRNPGSERHAAIGTLDLPENWSLSVSGGDERGNHIRDPRTGMPADSDVLQAAVALESGMSAEAWSTALLVLGSAGLELLLRQHPAARAVLVTAEQVIATPGWFQLLPSR